MKSMKTAIAFCLIVFGVACKSQNIVEAKIFERKEQDGNKLLIKYNYSVEGKQYTDSARIDNVVIEGDMIPVKFETSNPAKAVPQLNK